MFGFIMNDMEKKEIEYLLKREMEELLHDLDDNRIDYLVKRAMKERYQILYRLLRRFGNQKDCIQYLPQKNFPN